MPVSGSRVLGLARWKQRVVGGFHRTTNFEYVTHAAGNSDYRPGAATTVWSVLIDPRPIVRLVSDEDISEGGPSGISLGDYIIELYGDALTETQLLQATQVVLDKNLSTQEFMKIVKFRPGGWREFQMDHGNELTIVQGQVIFWKVWARATKRAA